ncbi:MULTISPECIES: enoyl-CoA hydratase/isomerase family protein [Actinopolyspora]|uniref:enoyl-CoA hydratase/isomerase family protein n=1 Tax=Actinopolyspora TaxID=1849 RepID=UPI00036CF808|nr:MULTISPECIES: enoyl-CoA hydratase/isomerase family protein [Actinopolyspora]NHD17772.1 enoyl-CoA hydratase/isomerase family protein [Actinopolyspora sp. BKK2]NHE76495.1 enoyl-CoA hydratase/isomerase family protein [Actinopolyspora sp. BKK1]
MSISLEREGSVAVIRIDRPDKLNALTLAMYDELAAAFVEVRDDAAIAAAVLTGSGGRAFCVGADLGESIPALAEGRFDISQWDGAHQKHTDLHKPVIGAVNGLCLGGGFEILLSTDLRIASEHAEFQLPEPRVGVVPAGGTLVRLTRQIPHAWAMRLLLLSERIGAHDALQYGLLNAVTPPDEVLPTAMEWAERLSKLSGTALGTIKEAVSRLSNLPPEEAFHSEALYGQRAFTSPDADEGLAAFNEARDPVFPSRSSGTDTKNTEN